MLHIVLLVSIYLLFQYVTLCCVSKFELIIIPLFSKLPGPFQILIGGILGGFFEFIPILSSTIQYAQLRGLKYYYLTIIWIFMSLFIGDLYIYKNIIKHRDVYEKYLQKKIKNIKNNLLITCVNFLKGLTNHRYFIMFIGLFYRFIPYGRLIIMILLSYHISYNSFIIYNLLSSLITILLVLRMF